MNNKQKRQKVPPVGWPCRQTHQARVTHPVMAVMNSPIELLDEIRRLMELKGENPFKVRAFEKASRTLAGRDDLVQRATAGTLTELEGVGKGIAEVLTEFLLQGKSTALEELRAAIPPGLLELTQVPGLGAKKATALVEELGIQTLAELEYACGENRLLNLPGFGAKLQQKILEGVQFLQANQGRLRLVDALPAAKAVLEKLQKTAPDSKISETGDLRRRMEVLTTLDFLIALKKPDPKEEARIKKAVNGTPLPVNLHFTSPDQFGFDLALTTASEAHWKALGSPAPFEAKTEEDFYSKLKLPLISAEARETGEEVTLAKEKKLDSLLPWDGIRGVFHNHTTRSDGIASLEQMVIAAKKLGYEYIGISDHSQSAFYAQGLKKDAILEQEKEVRALQENHPEIRIFWGIESDILADGSLDYEPTILKKFDFVIASIHSRFKADKNGMTQRILKAIRNPYTRFVGHITGRLLLGRPGYELDMEEVIKEAAKHDVAIEINANPARLDIDWRWGGELRKNKTMVSVNPDAHETAGLEDTVHGVTVARKALLASAQVLNARSPSEVEKWLKRT